MLSLSETLEVISNLKFDKNEARTVGHITISGATFRDLIMRFDGNVSNAAAVCYFPIKIDPLLEYGEVHAQYLEALEPSDHDHNHDFEHYHDEWENAERRNQAILEFAQELALKCFRYGRIPTIKSIADCYSYSKALFDASVVKILDSEDKSVWIELPNKSGRLGKSVIEKIQQHSWSLNYFEEEHNYASAVPRLSLIGMLKDKNPG